MRNCKKVFLLTIAFFSVSIAFAQNNNEEELQQPVGEKMSYVGPYDVETTKELTGEKSELQEKLERLMSYSKTFVGRPYRRGCKGPSAFDCSGFTSYVFKNIGIRLNASSSTQYMQGEPVAREELQSGDLVFFTSGRSRGGVGHVGIVVDADHEKKKYRFIHASTSRGVVIDNLKDNYFNSRYIGARRLFDENETM